MSVLVIEGTYRIIGAQPDGDSIRFYPTTFQDWDLVPGPHKIRQNRSHGAQLRLDGIDALETHYTVTGEALHQPLDLARAAADRLLDFLGFTAFERDARETVTSSTPPEVPGFILTRGADLYGRCIALAAPGSAPPMDANHSVFVDIPLLHKTANYQLLKEGLAYPTYYRKLFYDLRNEMTKAVNEARPKLGVWADDQTTSGVNIQSMKTLVDEAVIMPKLFRRLVGYFDLNNGDTSLDGFAAYLEQRDDRVFLLSDGQWTGLGTVVDVNGQTVKLTKPPEDLVFEER